MPAQLPLAAQSKKCAIYTRKSFQPPIAQELTSLESQRAICSAYIASQQHKKWTELAKRYDDAGQSGSTLNRPALQELLADVENGLVDVVLVYKLDRITRTILDFVRLIDFFDSFGVVFVAITQNFDTSDSMGRLIRNILLTFAQFEREIAIDRMRDKVRVMKERGLWTGGIAPVGYDLKRGKLVINPQEAAAVRCIFETYVEERRLIKVSRRLLRDGFRMKVWKSKKGIVHGGGPISEGTVHHVLGNPVYIGEIRHGDQRHPGIHQPIIDRALWDRAQEVLRERCVFSPLNPANLLTSLLFDGQGRHMTGQGHTRYKANRYYVSNRTAWAFRQKIKPIRVNATHLERLVIEALKAFLADRMRLRLALTRTGMRKAAPDELIGEGAKAASRLDRLSDRQLGCALRALVWRIEVHQEVLRIVVRLDAVPLFLRWEGSGLFALTELERTQAREFYVLDVPVAVSNQHKNHSLPVSLQAECDAPRHDHGLMSLLYDARLAQRLVFDNRDKPISELARTFGRRSQSFVRLVRLNYLAPDIVASILDGGQPKGLTRKSLMKVDLPVDWILQRKLLGYAPIAQSELPSIALEHRSMLPNIWSGQ